MESIPDLAEIQMEKEHSKWAEEGFHLLLYWPA